MQTIVVSLIALGALGLVARRVVAAIRPPRGQAACPSCASGSDSCGTVASGVSTGTPDVRPLVLVKSKSR